MRLPVSGRQAKDLSRRPLAGGGLPHHDPAEIIVRGLEEGGVSTADGRCEAISAKHVPLKAGFVWRVHCCGCFLEIAHVRHYWNSWR